MSSTAQQMRAWTGPALLTYGFRPFFLGAGVWAVIAMLIWLALLSGQIALETAFDPVSWHAHEFLFGYLTAVVAGFLLTAVPNWTGRLPIVGWPLAGLFALWVAGRVALTLPGTLSPFLIALIDLAMPFTLSLVLAREIIAGKNWRNLIVLAMLAVLMLGNAVFHWEAAQGEYAAQGYGLRIGLGAGVMMIAVIGGRVVPSFTRSWLVKQKADQLPSPPMQRFDKISLLALLIALLTWVATPASLLTAACLAVAGLLHVMRVFRWAGVHTRAEPLVSVLHIAYLMLPLGALGLAAEIAFREMSGLGAVQHIWMGGAIGLMTLAVMTRATLGHTGQALHAGTGTVLIYAAVVIAVLLRVAAGVFVTKATVLFGAAAIFWIASFAGFVGIYGPLLLRSKPVGKGQA
ncbi:hypothetical protein ROLI_002280 [Roseobacter fucihabitans]|uniref:Short-chain dehydrogenase n=1 Tax=Roseobacter fucihabitans TaxID=1537242 RepID=A0ABZ2BM70_9RHOB|nr:NnrS family protein [Roseobacter litoralis]MBC6963479.1 NnrS protein [Roseobacter litoralis]